MTRNRIVGVALLLMVAWPLIGATAGDESPKTWRDGDARLLAMIDDLDIRLKTAERRLNLGLSTWGERGSKSVLSAVTSGGVLRGLATQNDMPDQKLKCTLRIKSLRSDGTFEGTMEWDLGPGMTGGLTKIRGRRTESHVSVHEYEAIRQGDLVVGTRYLFTEVTDGKLVRTWIYTGSEGLLHGAIALALK